MEDSKANHAWLSAHLFISEHVYTPECDRVILDVVEPFVRRCEAEGWIRQYFFMRYSKRGPHVRFRLFGDANVAEQTVRPALVEHVAEALPTELAGKPQRLPDDPEPPEGVPSLLFIPYEPEVNRYGGPEGVRLAERFFHHSSEASLALLHQCRGQDHSAKLGKGLLAMVVLLHVFCESRSGAAALAERYATDYLQFLAQSDEHESSWQSAFDAGYDQQANTLGTYVDAAWERLKAGAPLSETLDPYREDLLRVRERFASLFEAGKLTKNERVPETWAQAVKAIVTSYLHMTSNRLGVTIPEESYLAHLIQRAMKPPEKQG